MEIGLVDSKQHMLDPNDILIAAAHDVNFKSEKLDKSAKEHGMSSERLKYIYMLKLFQNPKVIRIREGNTLFIIHPLANRAGYFESFNGDTYPNYINNAIQFFYAARKIGFDFLFTKTPSEEAVRVLKLVIKKGKEPNAKTFFHSKTKFFGVKTGERRT